MLSVKAEFPKESIRSGVIGPPNMVRFYTRPDGGKALIDEHQSLMWKVGELLGQWEMLTAELEQNR